MKKIKELSHPGRQEHFRHKKVLTTVFLNAYVHMCLCKHDRVCGARGQPWFLSLEMLWASVGLLCSDQNSPAGQHSHRILLSPSVQH